jgi:hypothetical protein
VVKGADRLGDEGKALASTSLRSQDEICPSSATRGRASDVRCESSAFTGLTVFSSGYVG